MNSPSSNRQPSLWRRASFGAATLLALAAVQGAGAQTVYTFSTTSTSTPWLTVGNWTGNTGHYPGQPTTTSASQGTSTDTADFGTLALVNVGINFNTTGGGLTLGNIDATAAFTTNNLLIGDSSTSRAGVLTLTGNTVAGTASTILSDEGTKTLTLAPSFGGLIMTVAMANPTNVIQITNSGSIAITTAVSGTGSGLTLTGGGSGTLTLSGANTYTGNTTVAGGSLIVGNATGTSATGTGNVVIGTATGGNAVLSGNGFISGQVTTTAPATGAATIAPGVNTNLATNFGTAGTLTLKGGLSVGAGTNFNFDLASTTTGTSDQISLASGGALTLGSTLTFNYNQLTANNLATGTAYTLISGATNTPSLSGVTINSTGLGSGANGYTPTYSVSGGSLFVTFSSASSPNYFGTTGQGYNASSTVFDTTTADFNTKGDGTGTAKVFDPTHTAIFGGTSGTVTVATVIANAGLEFDSTGYTLSGGALTLATTPTVQVTNATDTTTINTKLSGTVGLTKTGLGTLVLGSTTSDFTGGVAINSGTLSVSADTNLGAAANAVTLGGGTLAATGSFSSARGVSGTGALDVAPGATLALTGTVATTGLTLTDTGTLDLQATASNLGALTVAGAGTLASSTGGTVTLSALTAPNLVGTATISAALSLPNTSPSTVVVDVGPSGNLVLSNSVSTYPTIEKIDTGTLELDGSNTGLYRLQVGVFSATAPVAGGTVNFSNPNALGSKYVFLENGTLNATTPLTGANAVTVGISIESLSNAPAVLSGSSVEFAGASFIYETASQTNALTVNNTTTLSGVLATSNFVTGTSGPAKGNGLLITSTTNGTLILGGTAANTFTDAISIGGSATLVAAKATALGASAGVTINTGGTLLLGGTTTGRLGTVPVTLAGGTFATGGNTDSAGALTLSTNSNIDFSTTGSVLTFADSSAKTWSGVLMLLNYTDGSDALNFGTSSTTGTGGGLTAAQLNEVRYNGSNGLYEGIGFDMMGDVTFAPVPEPTTVLGGVLLIVAAGWSQRRRLRAAILA